MTGARPLCLLQKAGSDSARARRSDVDPLDRVTLGIEAGGGERTAETRAAVHRRDIAVEADSALRRIEPADDPDVDELILDVTARTYRYLDEETPP